MSNAAWIRTAVLLSCCAALGAGAITVNLSRDFLRQTETDGDKILEQMFRQDPAVLLGNTRAVYLQGYGVVYSAEIDIAPGLTPSPFKMNFSRDEIARAKALKRSRLPQLRDQMRDLMIRYAKSVDIPGEENVAVAITIPYTRMEDTQGMPKQIVMAASRDALRSGDSAMISSNLKVQEFF